MIGQLRAELLKQRSTPTALFLFLAMVGFVALAVALHVLALGAASLSTHSHQLEVFQVGTRAGMLFAALVGAIAITAETRYGTIRPTFLVTPRRGPVLTAKLAVSGLTGIIFGLLAEGLMAGSATIAFSARGISNQLTGGDYLQLLVGGGAAAALSGVLGVAIGALVRNQVGVLVGLCTWMFFIESVSSSFIPGVARFMPGGLGLAVAGNVDTLSATVALLVLVGYAAAASAAGWAATLRRDVA